MARLPLGTKIVVVHPPQPVRRSLRERLFTRPWRPLQTHKVATSPRWEAVNNSPGGLFFDGVLYVGPEVFSELKRHTRAAAFPDLMR